jgi:hypothetical protein
MIRQHHLIKSTLALAAALTATLAPAAWADPAPLTKAAPTSAANSQSNMAVRPNPDQQTATDTTANPGPCSEVCSGEAGSYGSASHGSRTLGPPTLRSVTASQLPEIHRQQTAAAHAFAYKPKQAQYSSAGLNGYVNSPTNGTPAIVHVTAHSNPFDWGDAAIGAAGGLVISLLMVGGAVVITHRRQTETSRMKALAG